MKLLQALRMQIAVEQTKVANLFAKQVGFNSIHDSSTVIERENAKDAWKWLLANKQLLLDSFPKENVKKLMLLKDINAETDPGEILIIFKQILRSQKARLISRKRYDWNTTERRQSYTLEYRIISATPDPKPPQPTPTLSVPQTSNTETSTPKTQDTNISDTKVSNTVEQLPQAVTMSAKRKLSPTPEHTQQPPDKKTKTDTPQKEEQTISKEQVSDVKVSSASPLNTVPPNSPSPTEANAVSPQALSPTQEGGLEKEQVPVDLPQIVS